MREERKMKAVKEEKGRKQTRGTEERRRRKMNERK